MDYQRLSKVLKTVIFVLIVFLVGMTSYIAIYEKSGATVCVIGSNSCDSQKLNGCEAVQQSKYSKMFGIGLGTFGFIAFIGLLALFVLANTNHKHKKKFYNLYLLAITFGILFALYFLYLQFFVIKSLCSTCLIVDGTTIAVFVLTCADAYIKKKI